jgi:uncharacterized SAM-binding protein YcdF (DUF218 family)
MVFYLRRFVGLLLTPSIILAISIALGTFLQFSPRRRRKGRRLVAVGLLALSMISLGLPFDLIGRWLEGRHPPILVPEQALELAGVRWIVVLGGGHRSGDQLPPSSLPNDASIYRIVEGLRLYKAIPESRIIFSGYRAALPSSTASVNAELARALGVDPERIDLEESPRSTAEEAARVRARVGDEPVVLVTTAVHMPRAVWIFEGAGLTVVPSPTGHQALAPRTSLGEWILPSPMRVEYADAVMHELLGLLAVRLGVP